MTTKEIIQAVRLCIDEEAVNAANISNASAYDYGDGTQTDIGFMNNIIASKINDALLWLCRYAPLEMLSGHDESGLASQFVIDYELVQAADNKIILPNNFVRLLRVRGSQWERAIKTPISEDSDEYLQLSDSVALATNDRPQAVFIDKGLRRLEVKPALNMTFEYSCVVFPPLLLPGTEIHNFNGFVNNVSLASSTYPYGNVYFDTYRNIFVVNYRPAEGVSLWSDRWSSEDANKYMTPSSAYAYYNEADSKTYRWNGTTLILETDRSVIVPVLCQSPFIYYLAFLVLTAYGDPRAERMLEIAKLNLGMITE